MVKVSEDKFRFVKNYTVFFQLWSAMPIGNWKGSILKEYTDPTRNIYTHDDYISLVGTTEVIFVNIPQLFSSLG